MANNTFRKVTLVALTADDIWTAEHPYSACICGWEECEPKRVYYPDDAAYREACEGASRSFYSHEYGCAADDPQDEFLYDLFQS